MNNVLKIQLKNIKYIDRKILFLVMLILPNMQPQGIVDMFPEVDKVFNIFKLLSLAVIFAKFLNIFNFPRINKALIFYAFYWVWILLITAMNNADMRDATVISISIFSIGLLINLYINDFERLAKAFIWVLGMLLIVNFITLLLFPNGMYYNPEINFYHNWFLGHKNGHIKYSLPCMILILLLRHMNQNKKMYRLLLAVSVLTPFLNHSSTSVICFVIFAFCMLPVFKRIINAETVFVGYICAFLGIVIFRLQNLFSFIIVDILHKDLTFTGRTYIWDATLELIKQAPIIGHGYFSETERSIEIAEILNNLPHPQFVHAHNQILEALYLGGAVSFACFIIFNLIIIKQLIRYRYTFYAHIGVACLASIYTLYLMEDHKNASFFIMYFFIANIEPIVKYCQQNKKYIG